LTRLAGGVVLSRLRSSRLFTSFTLLKMATQPTSPAFTAGPWYLDSTGKTELEFGYAQSVIRVFSADHRRIASLELSEFDMFDKKRRGIDPRWDAEQSANACLMTAAPDLLAALKGMVDCADNDEVFDHDSNGCDDCILCDARKAIAKAEL
jgi:hypothetical protein